MAIHEYLVIDDSYYDVQRMKRQYPQLASVPAKKYLPERRQSDPWNRVFFHQRGKSGEPWAVPCALG